MIDTEILFQPTCLGSLELHGRIVRSATYEGLAEADGTPLLELGQLYEQLATGGCAMITTGFTFVQATGRAMHPAQTGIHEDRLITPWQRVVEETRKYNPRTKLVMQLAHAGRQTLKSVTGHPVVGAGTRKCSYFRQRVRPMDSAEIYETADEFAQAARRAQKAGFDGIQLHAAHGYLLHQFLSPWTNNRTDQWRDGNQVLQLVIDRVRSVCCDNFPVLLKLSAADDNIPGIRLENTVSTVNKLQGVDAIEISYGTMEYVFNIIRGEWPINQALRNNPMFKQWPRPVLALWKRFLLPSFLRKLKPFSEDYNLQSAAAVQQATDIPVYPVGGFRSAASMIRCINQEGFPAVALCRPLINDPAWPNQIHSHQQYRSGCTSCNLCTVHVDSDEPLQCYRHASGLCFARDSSV